MQEAAQAFHWNNNQAILFPLVIYCKEGGELECCSFVGISDCLKHDTIAVSMFQEVLIKYLKIYQNLPKFTTFPTEHHNSSRIKKLLQIYVVIVMILMFMQNGIFLPLLTARDRVMD